MIQALREQRAAKARALADLVKKDGAWTEENQATYDSGMKEIDALDAKIKRINDSNALLAEETLNHEVADASLRVSNDHKSDGAKVYAKWLRGGDAALDAADMATIRNTMSEGTASQGGYTVQTEVAATVLEALKAYGGMRAVADVIQTTQGNPLSYPTSDGTSEVGEIVAENGSATAADASFGTLGLPVYKFSSKVITVPFELLQDSNVDIEAFVRNRLVTRLGRITNTKFTVGSGSSEPNGVVTAVSTGKTGLTGQTGTIIYDDLVDMQHSIDPAYRQPGNCRWMLNDASVKVIRKIKDGQNRPIFVPGYDTMIPGQSGSIPDVVLGDPVQINQDVATMAANAKSVLYGDFRYYVIRDVMSVTMFRFTDSVYTKAGQVGFLAWMRSGGNLMDIGGAIKAYANSAT